MSEVLSETKNVMLNSREIEIPVDWSVEKIGDVAEKTKGTKPGTLYEEPDSDRLPYLTISASKDEVSQWAQADDGKRVSEEEILMVWDGASSGTVFKSTDGIIGSTLASFNFDDGFDNDFAYYFLSYCEARISSLGEGTGISHVPRDFTEVFEILKPPHPEQRRIADILSTVDEQIQQTDEIIKETQSLRDGLLQNLFGDLSPKSSKKEVQLGPFQFQTPDHWEISELNDLNQDDYPICYGVVQPGDHDENGIPLLNIEDVHETGQIQRESIHKISPDLHEQYSRSQLQGGEVLVSVKGTVGNIVQLNEEIGEANISRDLARVTPTTKLDARWLKYVLSTKIYQDLIDVFSTGSTRSSLNIGDLREIPIICPPVSEQECISEVLSTVESKIETEREIKNHLQELKRGLMQDLLTGKRRTTEVE